MSRLFDFLRRKGYDNIYTEFWTPLFNGSVFNSDSLPYNRKNRIFEIKGMTVPTGTIVIENTTFTVSNGMIAVFNNKGILKQVMGSITEDSIFDLIAFNGTWLPEASSGINIRWERTFSNLGIDSVISTDLYTHTLTAPGIDPVSGVYVSNVLAPMLLPGATIYGVRFKLSNLFSLTGAIEVGLVEYENVIPYAKTPMSVTLTSSVNGTLHISNMGNQDTLDYADVNADTPWNVGSEYVLAYNPNIGTYGQLEFYNSSSLTPNTAVAVYTFTAAVDAPDSIFSAIIASNSSSGFITLVNEEGSFIPTGVTVINGGVFDEDTIPIDCAGKAYTALNPSPVYIPGYGECQHGDMIFWNALGDIQGRPWNRKDIEKETVVNVGMHTSSHHIIQGEATSGSHGWAIENEIVVMNSGILTRTVDYIIIGQTIQLNTTVIDAAGADILIITFNNVA